MLTIEPTGAVLGAAVHGIDLAQPLKEADMARILLAFGRRGVLRPVRELAAAEAA